MLGHYFVLNIEVLEPCLRIYIQLYLVDEEPNAASPVQKDKKEQKGPQSHNEDAETLKADLELLQEISQTIESKKP